MLRNNYSEVLKKIFLEEKFFSERS